MPLRAVIAGQRRAAYFAPMLAALLRWLTVTALALMPFGMPAASAAPVHHAPTAAGTGHCDQKSNKASDESPDGVAGCTAGCSMFIAELSPFALPAAHHNAMADRQPAQRWTSLPAETATPPPKTA